MLHPRAIKGAAVLSGLASSRISNALRNRDGSTNWKLIGIVGLGVALLAAVMGYRQERSKGG